MEAGRRIGESYVAARSSTKQELHHAHRRRRVEVGRWSDGSEPKGLGRRRARPSLARRGQRAEPTPWFGGFGRPLVRMATPQDFDGNFLFCRIVFRNAPNGDGNGWGVDYPRADINLTFRLSELTTTTVSRDPEDGYKHVVVRLTDPLLFHCPFVMMTERAARFSTRPSGAAARLPPQGRLPVGRRLLGRVRLPFLGRPNRQGAPARTLPDCRRAARPCVVSHALRHPPHSADSIDRFLGRHGRSDVRARPRQRRAPCARHL